MNTKKKLDLALLAGEIMLKSGAETNRVEDTMLRILKIGHTGHAEVFATTTGIFASMEGHGDTVSTALKRVQRRTINLEKVALVNDLSRKLTAGETTLEEGLEILKAIENRPPYPQWIKTLSTSICCFCFCFTLSGNLYDSFCSLIVGIFLGITVHFFTGKKIPGFLINILGGTVIASFALLLLNMGVGTNMDNIIIGSIMPLVPGVGIVNAIRDVVEGDFQSGTSRIVDALLIAIGIATGVGSVLTGWLTLFGGFMI